MRLQILLTASFLLFFLTSCIHAPGPFDEAAWRREVESRNVEALYAAHFGEGRYFNPWMPMEPGGFGRLLKWKLFSAKARYTEEEKAFRPGVVPRLKERIQSLPEGDFIAWLGHASFLMRLQGQYWLTDPNLSNRAFWVKRVTPPAITAAEIAELTSAPNILISHNHYDHLNTDTLRSMPEGSRFVVPRGLKAYVESFHRGQVVEMDWWDTLEAGHGVEIVCLPAQHWSRRIGQDTNSTLWASFLLRTSATSVYFAADSGYFIGYKEFGRRFPGIQYALMDTTAMHPRWFMHYAHKDIREALQAFQDLGATYFIPIQWGTFHLGDEPPGYPAMELKRTLRERNLEESRYLVMDIGQIERIRQNTPPVAGVNRAGTIQ
jgi:L-ascorbate metabolism protein UlaG (beta-lactamase superfamily)